MQAPSVVLRVRTTICQPIAMCVRSCIICIRRPPMEGRPGWVGLDVLAKYHDYCIPANDHPACQRDLRWRAKLRISTNHHQTCTIFGTGDVLCIRGAQIANCVACRLARQIKDYRMPGPVSHWSCATDSALAYIHLQDHGLSERDREKQSLAF